MNFVRKSLQTAKYVSQVIEDERTRQRQRLIITKKAMVDLASYGDNLRSNRQWTPEKRSLKSAVVIDMKLALSLRNYVLREKSRLSEYNNEIS